MHPWHWFSDAMETWFSKRFYNYKKHDRYKKSLEEKVNRLFENMFMAFMQNLSQER
jgi:hypothetical protein